jgi:hypothetical protein
MTRPLLRPIAVAALLAGCISPPRFVVRAAAREAPACTFRGRWSFGDLLGARSHVAFASASGAVAAGALVRGPAGPSLRLNLRVHGWTLRGTADLAAGHPLRPQRAVALNDVVTAHVGADIAVRDARPGEALIAPGRFAFGADQGTVRFVADAARWVPCDAIGFGFTFRDEHTAERERAAMGLPAELPARAVASFEGVDIAATPGGAPAVRLAPRDYDLDVRPLAVDGAFTRVLLQHWTSFSIVGWLPTASLTDPSSGGLGGILGRLGEHTPQRATVCRAPVEVTFAFARADAPLEYAGVVAAGTEFLRGPSTPGGGFVIAPYPRGASPQPARDVTWVAHALAPLACRDVTE